MENILDKKSEHQDFGRAISQNMPTQYLDKQNLIIDYTHIVRYTEEKKGLYSVSRPIHNFSFHSIRWISVESLKRASSILAGIFSETKQDNLQI